MQPQPEMNLTPPRKGVPFYFSPNFYTWSRFFISFVVVVMSMWNEWWIPIALLVCTMYALASDFLDGYFARGFSLVSDFGKIFDPAADSAFFVALFLALHAMEPTWVSLWMVVVVAIRESFQNVFLRPYMLFVKTKVVQAAWFGKWKMVLQCVYGGLALTILSAMSLWPAEVSEYRAQIDLFGYYGMLAVVTLSVVSLAPYVRALVSKD
ncbi:MAG: CDP-alcohol phosphatidyltransferase family protein [Planctomycetes bacterium]|nr:CDP-alcohol phosphatidyltransferase family protein [Planctomycetota bacterium]